MSRGRLQAFEVAQVAGVSEFVEINDLVVRIFRRMQHEIAADKAGAAGDKDAIAQGSSRNAILRRPNRALKVGGIQAIIAWRVALLSTLRESITPYTVPLFGLKEPI